MNTPQARSRSIAAAVLSGWLVLAGCSSPAVPTPAAAVAARALADASAAAGASGTADPSGMAGAEASLVKVAEAASEKGGAPNPCTLLTQAEVDAAVGQPLGKANLVLPGDCQWSTSDFAADATVQVGDWSSMKTAATSGKPPVSISGVGDEALNLNGSNGSILYVRKGDSGFMLTINGPHIDGLPDHGLAQEKIMAAAALGRL